MPNIKKIPSATIPYYTGVQGFTAPSTLGVPSHTHVQDESGQTSWSFDTPGDAIRVGFEGDAISFNEPRPIGIRVMATMRANGTSPQFKARFGPSSVTGSGTGKDLFPGQNLTPGVVQTFISEIFYDDWNDDPWTVAQINGTYLWFELENIDSGDLQIFDIYFYVMWSDRPIVTWTYPAYSQAGIALAPLVKWNYQGWFDPQYQYHIKVFDYDVFTAPGFDHETDPTVYDTGWITSSAKQHQIPTEILDPGELYVFWIQVNLNMNTYGQVGAEPYESNWTVSFVRANLPPTVLAYEPNVGTPVTTTKRPTLIWQYADVEGQPPLHHYVKVWTNDQYFDPDFDPDLTTPLRSYDAYLPQDLGGGYYQWRVETPLPDGVYAWGIRATQSGDGTSSEWAFAGFLIDTNFAAPAAGSLTVTPDEENGRVILTLQQSISGIDAQWYSAIKSYSVDGFVDEEYPNWLRGFSYESLLPYTSPSEVVTIYDYEVRANKIVTYWGVLYANTVDPAPLGAEPSPALSGTNMKSTILKLKKTWLKDPVDPDLNMSFLVEETWLTRSRNKTRTTKRPLGRKLPVQRRGASEGETFTVTFVLLGQDRYDAMEALLNSNRTLFYQTARSQWYVDVVSVDIEEHLWADLHSQEPSWKFKVGFQEVSKP